MKTMTAPLLENQEHNSVTREKLMPSMVASIRDAMTMMVAVLLAASIITLSVWVAGMEIGIFVGAGIWGTGFVFLALAVDNRGPVALYQVITGIALPILAQLQNRVSADFIIVSGVLLATWVAVALIKRVAL